MSDKLIRLKSVLEQFQVSKSHWYELISEGIAPKPIKQGRSSFWSQNDLTEFIESLKSGEVA